MTFHTRLPSLGTVCAIRPFVARISTSFFFVAEKESTVYVAVCLPIHPLLDSFLLSEL